jgi:hypothetical protein
MVDDWFNEIFFILDLIALLYAAAQVNDFRKTGTSQ